MYNATYNVVFPKRWSSLHAHVHTGSTAICLFTQCCCTVWNTEHVPTAQHSNCCVFKTDPEQGSWVSAVSERQRFDHRQRQRTFPQVSASRPVLGPTDLPLQWVPGVLSPGVKGGRSVTLTTHFQLVPRLRMSGAVLALPNTSPWRGAQLSTRNNFTFTPTAVSK
jgi:hypothetical protein